MNNEFFGAPFAAFSNGHAFPVMGNTFLEEEEVAHLADLFPTTIYFAL